MAETSNFVAAVQKAWACEDHAGFEGMDNRFCVDHCLQQMEMLNERGLAADIVCAQEAGTYEELVDEVSKAVQLF